MFDLVGNPDDLFSRVEAHMVLLSRTWSVGVILSLYLGHKPMPIPAYTRKKGFHLIRYPVHQVFAVSTHERSNKDRQTRNWFKK